MTTNSIAKRGALPILPNSIIGTGGNNWIGGTTGDDIIDGLAGNDTIWAGAGNDLIRGGAGDDIVYTGLGQDTVIDGTGADIVVLQGAGTVYAGSDLGGNTFIAVDTADTRPQILNYISNSGYLEADLASGFIYNSRVADIVSGFDIVNVSATTAYVSGASKSETITISGEQGMIFANAGDDVLRSYMTGTSFIDGGDGNDTIFTGNGDSHYGIGGNGDDVITGGTGHQFLEGDAGNDLLRGGDGDDELDGGAGADRLLGGAGNDRLADAESAPNGTGDDLMSGGNGDDILLTTSGADTLEGGAGADFFGIDASFGSTPNGTVIRDFHLGEDIIGISLYPGEASFIGTDLFHGVAGEIRCSTAGNNAIVQCDTDGNGQADFWFKLLNVTSLQASDLYLP